MTSSKAMVLVEHIEEESFKIGLGIPEVFRPGIIIHVMHDPNFIIQYIGPTRYRTRPLSATQAGL